MNGNVENNIENRYKQIDVISEVYRQGHCAHLVVALCLATEILLSTVFLCSCAFVLYIADEVSLS